MNNNPTATTSDPLERDVSPWAWGVSVAGHVVLVLLLALLVRGAPVAIEPSEDQPAERPVAITLVRQEPAGAREYLDADQAPATDALQPAPDDAAKPAKNLPEPTAGGASAPAGLELPEGDDGPLRGDGGDGTLPGLRVSEVPRNLPRVGPSDAEVNAAARAAGEGGGRSGPAVRLQIFGRGASGGSFVFVIDRSHSMGPEYLGVLSAAERELNAAIGKLTPQQKFQIITYNQQTYRISRRGLMPATDPNKRKAAKFLAGVTAYGGTQHHRGLLSAVREKADVIFLLTDGGDPGLTDVQRELILDGCRGGTRIFALQFGKEDAPPSGGNFMKDLALRTGGRYSYVKVGGRD